MRRTLQVLAIFVATPAIAHPGHIDLVDGHSHGGAIVAGVAALVILAIALAPVAVGIVARTVVRVTPRTAR